jgi:ketosteroid isomerase-like protein
MAPDNVETVRRAFDALDDGGVEAMLPYIHDDFEMTTPSDLASEPDTYRGHDGVRRWFDSFYEAMDEVRLEIHELQPNGEQVAVRAEIVARGRTTSLEMRQAANTRCSVVDGRIKILEFFASWEDAVAPS